MHVGRTKPAIHRIHSIDHLLIKTLNTFQEPFKQTTEYLGGETYPTIHNVFIWKEKLLRCMAESPTDCDLLKFLKKRGGKCILEKFEISDMHLIAFFLHPKFKSLVAIPHRKEEIKILTKALRKKFSPPVEQQAANDHSYMLSEPIHKSIDEEFLDWQQCREIETCDDEVDKYSVCAFHQLEELWNYLVGARSLLF